jgi:hypothetical protein
MKNEEEEDLQNKTFEQNRDKDYTLFIKRLKGKELKR